MEKTHNFVVGQKVRIKIDAYNIPEPYEHHVGFNYHMRKWCGSIVTISRKLNSGYSYCVYENTWSWNKVWLEPLIEESDIFIK